MIGSCIRHIPLAGRNITQYVLNMLRERGEPLPSEDALEIARKVKEQYWYHTMTCKHQLKLTLWSCMCVFLFGFICV